MELIYNEYRIKKNRKIIKDFPYLLAVGARRERNLLTDDIVILPVVKKISNKNFYFYFTEDYEQPVSLFDLKNLQTSIVVYFEGRIKTGVEILDYDGSGPELAKKILEIIPEGCKIIGLALVSKDSPLHDIIVYRHKDGEMEKIIQKIIVAQTNEPVRNYVSG